MSLSHPLNQAELGLHDTEERLRVASLAANLGVWTYDGNTRIFSVDENVARLFSVPHERFGTRFDDFLNRVCEKDRARVAEQLERALAGQGDFFVDFHVELPDGERRDLQARGTVTPDTPEGSLVLHGAMWDATDLLRAQRATRESELRFRTALENAPIGMALVDANGRFTRVNGALCRALGYSESELLQRTFDDITHPNDLAASREALALMEAGEADTYRAEKRYLHADGHVVWVSLSIAIVRRHEDGSMQFVAQVEDITERRRTQKAYKQAEQRFRSAFDEARVGMAIVDVRMEGHATLDRVNPMLCALTGKTQSALEGSNIASIIYPEDLEKIAASFGNLARGGVAFSYEARCLGPDGGPVAVGLNASVMLAADRFRQVLLHVQDITDRKRAESWLQHLADHDPLTGLFNRRRFAEELDRELSAAARYGTGGAVLALDLDGFKYVNDTMGHAAGDELITRVARLLRERLRDSDILARLGGDEFAVILPHADETGASSVAQGLIDAIREGARVTTPEGARAVTASVGVSLFFEEPANRTGEELLVEADIAMYDAKELGRDQLAVFDPESERQSQMTARLTWADRIKQALAEDRFVLHAQPILSLDEADGRRHELLLRMIGEDGDLIPPACFLEIAERFDLIQEIDRWVVRRAIALLSERHAAGEDACFEVNLSAKSIVDPSLPDLIEDELRASDARPEGLVFEVTETAAIVNVERARMFARRLAELGCEFALDDFGSGFASFYYLKHLAFDYVKIDGEFIKDLPGSETSQLVVRSVVELARGLGKKTIAEFVEDEATLELLREYGVDYAQGFHIGKPMPLEAVRVL